MTAAAAALLTGCAAGREVTTSVASPSGADALARSDLAGSMAAGPGATAMPGVATTAHQRSYLDGLAAAGVQRSSDLMALSIGSYVCQARAAGQSDQAVWEFVAPLVRGDIDDAATAAPNPRPMVISVDEATAQYIRIATEQLC